MEHAHPMEFSIWGFDTSHDLLQLSTNRFFRLNGKQPYRFAAEFSIHVEHGISFPDVTTGAPSFPKISVTAAFFSSQKFHLYLCENKRR